MTNDTVVIYLYENDRKFHNSVHMYILCLSVFSVHFFSLLNFRNGIRISVACRRCHRNRRTGMSRAVI